MKYDIKRYLNKKTRMANFIRQSGFSFIFKIIAMGCNFLLVPITLNCLGKESYGIWLTMLSILSWMTFCDFGIGNGLRNKVIIELAKKDFNAIKEYISSTYIAVFIISLLIMIVVLLIAPFLNWQMLFNTQAISSEYLKKVTIFVVFFMTINFVASLINQILHAYQKSALTVLNQLIGNFFALVITYILVKTSVNDLFMISIAYASALLFSNCIISYYFFRRNNIVSPSIHSFRLNKLKELSSLSLKFFVIQIATLILYTKDNVMITQIFGPEFVTPYNITFRLFNLAIFFAGIVLTPLWSAFGDAYACEDIAWIKNTMKKMNLLMLPFSVGIILLCFFAPYIFSIWVGEEAKQIGKPLIWLMGLFSFLSIWNNIYAMFINATGKLRLLLYITGAIVVTNIPLSFYCMKLFGVNGTLIATIFCMIPSSLLVVFQYNFILKEKSIERGNWRYKLFCK